MATLEETVSQLKKELSQLRARLADAPLASSAVPAAHATMGVPAVERSRSRSNLGLLPLTRRSFVSAQPPQLDYVGAVLPGHGSPQNTIRLQNMPESPKPGQGPNSDTSPAAEAAAEERSAALGAAVPVSEASAGQLSVALGAGAPASEAAAAAPERRVYGADAPASDFITPGRVSKDAMVDTGFSGSWLCEGVTSPGPIGGGGSPTGVGGSTAAGTAPWGYPGEDLDDLDIDRLLEDYPGTSRRGSRADPRPTPGPCKAVLDAEAHCARVAAESPSLEGDVLGVRRLQLEALEKEKEASAAALPKSGTLGLDNIQSQIKDAEEATMQVIVVLLMGGGLVLLGCCQVWCILVCSTSYG